MTDDERRALWRQYAQVHAKAQDTFDLSVRTLAAAGLAVTVALATALKELSGWGVAAVVAFLLTLGFNLLSYTTAQLDIRRRLEHVKVGDARGREETSWTTCTFVLNVFAGVALIVAGALLAWSVGASSL